MQYHYKWTIIGPQANGVSLAGQKWPNFEHCLGSLVIFQGIRTNIAKKPYTPMPPPPPLDPNMIGR